MITIGIIGLVAAITLPSLIGNYQSKVRAEQNRMVQYKLTKATDKMKSMDLIGPYESTETFVQELKNHFKIAQVCKNDNLEQCWPTKTIFNADGNEVKIADLKNGKDFNPSDYSTANVGLITSDGTSIIMSYKDNCAALDSQKTYQWSTDNNKPVTNATTSCIAMIYDLNGKGRPNKAGEDIRLFNVTHLGSGRPQCLNYAGVCMMIENISAPPAPTFNNAYKDYVTAKGLHQCSDQNCYTNGDYWIGYMQYCDSVGGRLPTMTELYNIANKMYADINQPMVDPVENPLNLSGLVFSSEEDTTVRAYSAAKVVMFTTSNIPIAPSTHISGSRYKNTNYARCVFD